MKIVCDSCGAKYSIADEKVAGKVFKIRCKKCSSVIVVRGDQVSAAEPATASQPPADYGADAIWHVVIEGEQQGPYTPAQIGDLLSAGTIDWEAYVWREGFDGWQAARDVGELVEAVTGQPSPDSQARAASQPPAGASADPFSGAAADFSGGAGSASADSGGGLFAGFGGESAVASRATRDAGADLFASVDAGASPFGGSASDDEDVVASKQSPRVSEDQSLTGQRNENSVLFSLSNLQALATGSPGGAAPISVAPAASGGTPAGHASGEGSGLIDIRALATATATVGAAPATSGAGKPSDDLLTIGGGPALGSPLAAPVLAPAAEEPKSNKALIYAVAGGGVAVLAAAVVLIVVLSGEDEPEQLAMATPIAGQVQPTAAAPGAAADPAAASATAARDRAADDEVPVDEAEAEEEEEEVDEDEGSSRQRSRRSRRNRRRSSGSSSSGKSSESGSKASAAAEPEPSEPAESSSSRGGGGGSLDDLLNKALGGGGGGSAPQKRAASADANLPDLPARDAVRNALQSVSGSVAACGQGQHGMATTDITVKGSTGRVTSARVTGQFAGTPVGSCVARAVRRARFPKFKRNTFSVKFPYRL